MEKCKIILTNPISEISKKDIMSINPEGIDLIDVTELSRLDYRGDDHAKEQLSNILLQTDVVYGGRLPVNLLQRAPKLKWLQVTSAGVDRYLTEEFKKSPVILTNVSGIHAVPIGEFVLTFMLMCAKRIPYAYEMKQKKEWGRYAASILRDKTVGIVGLGHIGQEVARLSKAFGMNVIATRRSAKNMGTARNVDMLLPASWLNKLLTQSDFVVITLPLTDETRNLFSDGQFRLMKESAYIINIGRGPIIDEPALIRALNENQIAGAGLDVFSQEPLPASSPLWDMPNVIMTPHVSGGQEDYEKEANKIFCENLKRFLAGKRLMNVVNKKTGY
ncbi:MAG: D-2-hydroxyacid dehydrogenase [Dehalococcoidales bacterium]|nr:D-2-hydroxyacid dehydrogenase [Dehalococcoidales bacterium]